MRFAVSGETAYASTGGREHRSGNPWIVLVHGAGGNHLLWLQQARSLAYDGCNVLALDLPGHCHSGGDAIAGIENQARWVLDAMSAAGCQSAIVVGHSMGGPIALEAALAARERVAGIVFVATAAAIPVSRHLIEMAGNAERDAIDMMMAWAHGPAARLHVDVWPGKSHLNFAIDMMRRNCPGTLAVDLANCAGYANGVERAQKIRCPTRCLLAKLDRMTPIANGMALADALPNNRTVILEHCGHMIPTERSGLVTDEIRRFLYGINVKVEKTRITT